jgi:hypothetical protein
MVLNLRFSLNTIIYIFPVRGRLAAFNGLISAISQKLRDETAYEYYYGDVVGFQSSDLQTTIDVPRRFWFGTRKASYRMQQFSLRIASGDDVTVTIGFQPVDDFKGDLPFALAQTDFEDIIKRIRNLLRSRKHDEVQHNTL